MKEKDIYPLQSNNFIMKIMNFPDKAFYFEWNDEKTFCLYPGNGEDFIWSVEKKRIIIAQHLDNCRWMEQIGRHILGIHIESMTPVEYNKSEIGKMFEQLMMYDSFEQRYFYVARNLPAILKKKKIHPVLCQAVNEIQKTHGQFAVEDFSWELAYHYSVRQIERVFKETFGYGPKYFGRKERLLFVIELLLKNSGKCGILEIENAGFSDRAHYQREFKKFMGMTPGNFLDKCSKV